MKRHAAIFDTNALPVYGGLEGPLWLSVRKLAAIFNLDLIIPDLVILESANMRAQRYQAVADDFVGSHSEMAKYADLPSVYVPSAEEVRETWIDELKAVFYVIEIKHEDATEALRREALRLRPARLGKGARDSAIWLTVLRLMKDYRAVYFVSKNTKDFGQGKGGILHQDLQGECREIGQLEYFTSLDALIGKIATAIDAPPLDQGEATDAMQLDLRQAILFELNRQTPKQSKPELLIGSIRLDSFGHKRAYEVDGKLIVLVRGDGSAHPTDRDPIRFTAHFWVEMESAEGSIMSSDLESLRLAPL